MDSQNITQGISNEWHIIRSLSGRLNGYYLRLVEITNRERKKILLIFFLLVIALQGYVIFSAYTLAQRKAEFLIYISDTLYTLEAVSMFKWGIGAVIFFWGAMYGLAWLRKQAEIRAEWEALPEEEKERIAFELEEQRMREGVMADIHKEALRLAGLIPLHLAIQHKVEHTYRPDGKIRHRPKTVRLGFGAILYTETEIWYHIDGRKLPSGTSFWDLEKEENHVLHNLQRGIGKQCTFHEDKDFRLYLRVGLQNSLKGIPLRVSWFNAYHRLPERNTYTLAMGVNAYGKLIYKDITDWPHGLILGGTGNGKSTFVRQALVTLALRNSPEDLNLVLIDLKRVDFAKFKEMPHVVEFVDHKKDVVPTLTIFAEEINRRLDMFAGTCENITGWNAQNPHRKLPKVFIWVDELALITVGGDNKLKKAAVAKILDIVAIGRAAGVHIFMATQTVSKQVLPMEITANVEGRLCFGLRNTSASILAVGNATAVGLEPRGRAVFVDGPRDVFVQSPIIADDELHEQLDKICGRETEVEEPMHIALFRHALDNYGGKATRESLFATSGFSKGAISKTLKAYEFNFTEEKVFDIDGNGYILTPSYMFGWGESGRHLLPVNGTLPTEEDIKQVLITRRPLTVD